MKKKIFLLFSVFPLFLFSNDKRISEYEKFKGIFSISKEEVVKTIYEVGERKIEKCIPVLFLFLNDENFVFLNYDGKGKWTRIDREVEEALIKIGKPSLNYISNLLLKNDYPYVEIDEKIEEKIVNIVSKITGKNFSDIDECKSFLKERKIGTEGES